MTRTATLSVPDFQTLSVPNFQTLSVPDFQTLRQDQFPLSVHHFLTTQQLLAARGQSLDFSFDYIQWLCEEDRDHCDVLLQNILRENSRGEKWSNNVNLRKSDAKDKLLFGVIPRHGYLLLFLPFFPLVLVFVSANGVAFLVTGLLETLLRYQRHHKLL